VGGSGLVRQHAAALLVALVASGESGACDVEGQKLLVEPLNNCCCGWMHAASRVAKMHPALFAALGNRGSGYI